MEFRVEQVSPLQKPYDDPRLLDDIKVAPPIDRVVQTSFAAAAVGEFLSKLSARAGIGAGIDIDWIGE